MDHFLAGRIADSLEEFEKQLERAEGGDLLAAGRIRCNMAVCLFELGLYRKCVGLCESLRASGECPSPRVDILLSEAYYKLNRPSEGAAAAQCALQRPAAAMDVCWARDLHRLSQGCPAPSPPPPPTPTPATPPKPPTQPQRNKKVESDKILAELRGKYLGDGPNQISESLARLVLKDLSYCTGDDDIDLLIVLGNAQMNYGNFPCAVEIFQAIIKSNSAVLAAELGLGSAFALSAQFDLAIQHFTSAISLDPTVADAWKRRGQTRAASGKLKDALNDFMRAASLTAADPDVFFQIGVVKYRLNNFHQGRKYIEKAINEGECTADAFNSLGMCCAQLGEVSAALTAYDAAIQKNPEHVDALYNSGIIVKENGEASKAEEYFRRCISINIEYKQAHYSLGVLHYSLGRHNTATEILLKHTQLTDRTDTTSLSYLALSLICVGSFVSAMQQLNTVIGLDPESGAARTQREVLLYLWKNLDTEFKAIDIDNHIKSYMKDAWCKKISWEEAGARASVAPIVASAELSAVERKTFSEPNCATRVSDSEKGLIICLRKNADAIGGVMQLNTPGFLPNIRQHRMFGLSVVHIAAFLKASLAGGELIPWRRLLCIAVRWRQISEPNDAVWWIDGFSRGSFEEGFGLETPIVQGQLRVIRYYSYFQKAFDTVKRLLSTNTNGDCELFPDRCCFKSNGLPLATTDASLDSLLSSTATADDLWHAVGEDFYVITRYRSLCCPDRYIEGTRITLLTSHPDGFKFTIRTPGTPARWDLFNEELSFLCAALRDLLGRLQADDSSVGLKEDIFKLALQFFYVWVVFAPLSRGSAVCGYACLHGVVLAAGFRILKPLPEGVQLDWEAILAPSLEDFVDNTMSSWLLQATEYVTAPVGSDSGILALFATVNTEAPIASSSSNEECSKMSELLQFFDGSTLRTMLYLLTNRI